MKKKLLTLICCLMAGVLSLLGFAACGKVSLLEENLIDDNYDNYYEIFVRSFRDSDGDGVGDLNGVTEKLDYIRDLGYTGIWLMPIHPSPSYHGYDVKDYYNVNPNYGTMEDYDNLLTAAHEKGIKVIIDLVVNHTSSQHPWFTASASGDAKYRSYYTWSSSYKEGYNKNGNSYYESWFSGDMPDLNLDNSAVRGEIENIMKFWLEKGTDGFRLDGVMYYYKTDGQKSVDFCKWIKDTAVKYNENAYIVGEAWTNRSTITDFYKSGCDSFFCFPAAQADGYIASSVNTQSAATYWSSIKYVNDMAGQYIPAPFICNHDTGRAAGIMQRDPEKIKFAYGLLSMYSGNTFTYYGDEIGMIGSQNDPDKRIGMLWDKPENVTKAPPGVTSTEYIFDGVDKQLKDKNSILNYYKVCNNVRNAFPSIMRGTTKLLANDDPYVLAFSKTYGDETVKIVINFSTEKKTVTVDGKLAQGICVSGSVKQGSGTLTMPKYSIAILT
ncbi:MAG: hypothetical protein HDP34_00285 [Clostridia bacterium]|nr:hypothetical protein [Clostridia bacterium]